MTERQSRPSNTADVHAARRQNVTGSFEAPLSQRFPGAGEGTQGDAGSSGATRRKLTTAKLLMSPDDERPSHGRDLAASDRSITPAVKAVGDAIGKDEELTGAQHTIG